MGQANRENPLRVFDWDKAAHILRYRNSTEASAGLEGDWEWTGGLILKDGRPVPPEETYTYLASTWATPLLDVDGDEIECWRYEHDVLGWDAGTYWPESALSIFRYGNVIEADEAVRPLELPVGDG